MMLPELGCQASGAPSGFGRGAPFLSFGAASQTFLDKLLHETKNIALHACAPGKAKQPSVKPHVNVAAKKGLIFRALIRHSPKAYAVRAKNQALFHRICQRNASAAMARSSQGCFKMHFDLTQHQQLSAVAKDSC
jgi:hypothetical protein